MSYIFYFILFYNIVNVSNVVTTLLRWNRNHHTLEMGTSKRQNQKIKIKIKYFIQIIILIIIISGTIEKISNAII